MALTKQQVQFKKAVALAKQMQRQNKNLSYQDAIKKAFAQMKKSKVGASNNSVKKRKTEIEYVIQGNYGYGHGYEDLSAYDNRKDAIVDLKAYRENERNASHRLITRRVKIGAIKIIQKGENKNAKVTKTFEQVRGKRGLFKGYKRISGIGYSLNKRGQLI